MTDSERSELKSAMLSRATAKDTYTGHMRLRNAVHVALKKTQKTPAFLPTTKSPEDIYCPVCGYYCLGRGGVCCIDKPTLRGYDLSKGKEEA